MKLDFVSCTNFNGVSVAKGYKYSFEQQNVINTIKGKLLRGKVINNCGKDLYKKFDQRGYNFYLTYNWQNKISVYIDKVKNNKSGKKSYEHKFFLGDFNAKNVNTFEECVKEKTKTHYEIKDIAMVLAEIGAIIATTLIALFHK